MCVSRAKCAILLVLLFSFLNCPTFKQRFGAPLRWRPPPALRGQWGPFLRHCLDPPLSLNKLSNSRALYFKIGPENEIFEYHSKILLFTII